MRICVSEIPEGGLTVTVDGAGLDREALKGLEFETLPEGDARIGRVGRNVFVRGRVRTTLRLECSRCLERIGHELDLSFSHTLRPHDGKVVSANELELQAEDLECGTYEEDAFELNRIIEEQIVLAVPMKALCFDECKGLCPKCGANLNESLCRCPRNGHSSPFGKLKEIVFDK
ncbi:MAG: DUF177 domain-containing protein [bacterium]